MPEVDLRSDPLTPRAVLGGWLGAALAAPSALLLVVLGQGLGAVVGGCRWIGVASCWTRTPWALVNQPRLDFAASPAALGYWFGGAGMALLAALATVPLVRRPSRLATELLAIQVAWWAALAGCCWLPLLDGGAGHPGRWLELHGLPVELLWLLPAAGAVATLLPTLRLLALLRSARPHAARWVRLAAVALQLLAPVGAALGIWAGLAGAPPLLPTAAVVGATALAVGVAWRGWPLPYAWRLEPPSLVGMAAIGLAAVLIAAGVWLAGRPLPDHRVAGILWSRPDEHNNIRGWIEARPPAAALTGRAAPAPTVY